MEHNIYNKYSDYLKDYFGEKVYKLPISLPLTCPNRDGTCGTGGCIYCSEEGGSHENLENTLTITEQLNIIFIVFPAMGLCSTYFPIRLRLFSPNINFTGSGITL